MNERQFQFEWDEAKAAINFRKHGISFEVASTTFSDPRILTVADTTHSGHEERWFSIGVASNGSLLFVAYLWTEVPPDVIKIRLITARRATTTEIQYYTESQ